MVDIDNFKLDFLGVVNLFGGDVALAAVHYCVVERTFFDLLWTFYLSPGMYVIALKILKRTENPLAMALSPGDRDECREVVGLMESGNFTYAGLLSGTCAKVSNLIGEAVLNISKGKVEVKGPMEGKKAKRETNVNVIKVDYKPEKNAERIKAIKKDRIFIILDILPPLLTLGASAYLIWANKIFAAIIVILGAFSNLSLTWATCAEGCKYMSGEPSDKSPPGHCIVKDDSSPNQIWVVLGNELSIQYLLQRPIIVELNQFWILMNLITGVFAYAYTIFTILVLPSIDTFEQLIMAALLIIGFLANIMYAKRDGVKLLSKIAERDMKVEYKEGIKFTNRASAVAYCVLRCKGTNGYTSDFLPDIDVWKSWKEFLAYLSRNQDIYLSDESQENFDLMNLAKEWQNNISRNEI